MGNISIIYYFSGGLMLTFELNNTVLTVIETTHAFFETKKSYLYIDVINWYKNGRTLSIDDTNMTFKMSDESIEWCKKYYLPKVGIK
jgi:hypothetical protein